MTITAFVAMRKNDRAMSAFLKKQEQERKEAEKK